MKHIVFYDGQCPLCNRAVRFLLSADRNNLFYFAPLNGKTAGQKLAHLYLKNPELDTLIVLLNDQSEEETILIEGKGALRLLWLLGGKYKLVGWLSFLPAFLTNPIYRFIARHRYHFFPKSSSLPQIHEKFLP